MKCIQALRDSKPYQAGDITKVKDAEALSKVDNRYWKYVPKSEWKTATKKPKPEEIEALREKYPANVEGSKEFKNVNNK
tara:strand:- start:295 stop:531 length:237 start_codon:yes stop_codon:yes gene_type:complete